ncbi:MAG: hypothetical protein KC729_10860 [Candidatus Eisenbacteria bacterium]|uniref:FlgD/Vpr Ig-like domain-containing protein n=1 Tax=Eiseniibacteriota bacterium TaxID=2212470 RepID=A0A956LYM1_UNCEI|nr:hypothetical protein [Candidatus Eisenbacteria bacterium]
MRKCFALMAVLVLAGSATVTLAKEESRLLPLERVPTGEEDGALRSIPGQMRGNGIDTVSYGDVAPNGFSIYDDVWDWDNPSGGGGALMGWYATDVTEQATAYGRQITAASWAGHGNQVSAPILTGTGSLWIGAFEDQANALCWDLGLGYGNSWCQRAISPVISLASANNVTVNFKYFNDTELNFDYTKVILRRLPSGEETTLSPFDGFTDKIGLATAGIPTGAAYVGQITTGVLQGSTQFQLVFQMESDGGWSDEDGQYATEYGPFGVDDVVLGGGASASYNFDASAQGWTFQACPGIGSFFNVGNLVVNNYDILDPCGCGIQNNLLEFHDDSLEHPYGQRVEARSNMTDVLDMGSRLAGNPGQLEIFADWDQYSVMPRVNGVFYRPGWDYYPFECAVTGAIGWSGRVGQNGFFYNPGPDCSLNRNTATSNGVPPSCERIKFIFELYASCDGFGIPESDCTNQTNFTPIIDNVQVRGTKVPAAPIVVFSPSQTGTRYQDGFAQTFTLDPNGTGNADTDINVNFGRTPPFVLGDSLFVTGPVSTLSTMWEARLWFKVRREGPGTKPARYTDWKNDVDAVNGNPNPTVGFAYAWMDSFQTANGIPAKNSFVSYCREDNWYPGESGEFSDGNEIIRDGVLVAGTAIDYFVTSNYVATPSENYYLPDTTGGFFFEFEILPSWRNDGGTLRFPCLLYLDTNTGAENFVEAALAELGLEHDRYDYNDASSNWKAPMARGSAPANNGVPLPQLMGYRGIMLNTGALQIPMWQEDYILFNDWLNTVVCDGSLNRQGMMFNGDNSAAGVAGLSPTFLAGVLGATFIADDYNGVSGGNDQNYCVQLETPLGGGQKYGTTNSRGSYDYDAWGNWCPQQFLFDVIGSTNGGVGNRAYVNISGGDTNYNQVAREVAGTSNYRVVIDGTSWNHLSERDALDECVGDSAHIVTATFNELASGLEWIFGGAANIPSLCVNPCNIVDVDDLPEIGNSQVTRLYQNSPNPFNPRTVLRFSLAQSGPVELSIFDVNGRKVRTLVSDTQDAGLHEVVWDGTDDAGHPVASGVFWSQLETTGYTSNKKMVVLR